MELEIHYLGDVRFEASARGHKIVCDQPPANGGKDEGMSPPELLLASLGTCAAYYAVQYLNARSLPSTGLEVKVSAQKSAQPARLGRFRIAIDAPGVEGDRHREGLLRAARNCLIHNTLLHAPEIEIEVNIFDSALLPVS